MLQGFNSKVITVDCVKQQRPNLFSPAVVERQGQEKVQFDWVITGIKINDADYTYWFKYFGFDTKVFDDIINAKNKLFPDLKQGYKTKKEAHAYVARTLMYALEYTDEENYWRYDDEQIAECQKVLASLQ